MIKSQYVTRQLTCKRNIIKHKNNTLFGCMDTNRVHPHLPRDAPVGGAAARFELYRFG